MSEKKKRILIVDDDEIVRRVLTVIVESVGVEAETVRNGEEAVARLKEGMRFDLIILDLIMPFKNGWEVLDKIERNHVIPNVPIVVITGAMLAPGEMEKLLNRTCAVISKGSFEINHVKNLMDDLLKERR